MKRVLLTACLLAASTTISGDWEDGENLTENLPELFPPAGHTIEGFEIHYDSAQYREGDWSGCVGIARGVTIDEALAIAKDNPQITFFFYTKGLEMVLQTETDYRLFFHGDAVFFTGQPQFGSAPGLADGYVRVQKNLEM